MRATTCISIIASKYTKPETEVLNRILFLRKLFQQADIIIHLLLPNSTSGVSNYFSMEHCRTIFLGNIFINLMIYFSPMTRCLPRDGDNTL